MLNNEGLLKFSKLLNHSKLQVKNDAIYIMSLIINCEMSRNEKRNPHPFYEQLRRDGVIYLLN